jgi:peptidoglycan/xylan/chitin deacetylase (PgdA/CDA1 family)
MEIGEPVRPDSGAGIPDMPEDVPDLTGHTVVFSVDDGYHSVFTNVYPLLKRYRMTMTLGVITDYLRGGNPSYNPSAGFMRKSEIQELIDSCDIEIASHSLSHPFLTRLDSGSAWREIKNSKTILESLFGQEVVTFVYPYGDMNRSIRDMVKRSGYRMGRAVRPGTPDFEKDPLRLPIIELRRETRLEDLKKSVSRRKTTILLMHQIIENPTVFTQWNLTDFVELVDWLDRANVRVTTLSELYREWWYRSIGEFVERISAAYPDSRKELLFQQVDIDATQAFHP